ncbi:hypothetical protein LEMLEM_LOCUS23615 [Lemmus lemmus]
MSHHAPQFHSFPSSSKVHPSPLHAPPKEKEIKVKPNNNKTHFAPPCFPPLRHLFIHLSGIGSLGVSHNGHFVLSALPANVHGGCWGYVGRKVLRDQPAQNTKRNLIQADKLLQQ